MWQALLFLAFYLHTHLACDRTDFAYPKPDRSIRDFLLNTQHSATDVKIGYHLFFMCLFRKLSAHFNAIQGKISRQKMAIDWKNHLRGQMRNKFYEDLTRDINVNVYCIFRVECSFIIFRRRKQKDTPLIVLSTKHPKGYDR